MKNGVHTIRHICTGIGSGAFSLAQPQRLTLDNGSFKNNFIIESFRAFPVGVTATNERIDTLPMYIVLATSEAGARFDSVATRPLLAIDDSRVIGFWSIEGESGSVINFLDPDHIIIEDLWVNACTVTAGGTVQVPDQDLGVIINLKKRKTTEIEAILQLIKQNAQSSP